MCTEDAGTDYFYPGIRITMRVEGIQVTVIRTGKPMTVAIINAEVITHFCSTNHWEIGLNNCDALPAL